MTALLLDDYSQRSQRVLHTIESAAEGCTPAMQDQLQDMIYLCIDLGATLNRLWMLTQERLRAGQLTDVQRYGRTLQQALATSLKVVERVAECAARGQRMGCALNDAGELDQVQYRFTRAQHLLATQWPWINLEEVKARGEAASEEDSEDVETILHELQGKD